MPTPILFLSDAATAGTGLSRITRDLATRVATHMPDMFRVASLGYGGISSARLPFHQYYIEGMENWVIPTLPDIWKDFAGDEKGVVMSIWDASRMLWFARPETCEMPHLRKFLESKPFQKWGYFPIDATGPHDTLTGVLAHTIDGYDRILCYTEWAEEIVRKTLPNSWGKIDNRPHGLDSSVFYPRPRKAARHGFGERIGAKNRDGSWLTIPDDALMVGIVATNQVRKDFGLGIATVAELCRSRKVVLWIHTDELERHWSIPALLRDFGLLTNTVVTTIPLTDDQMAFCYSACDVTLGIGNGEGWGYCLTESLACGTPVIHGNYGGGTDFVPPAFLVEPLTYRIEGPYCCVRGVYTPQNWAQKALAVSGKRTTLPTGLDWSSLWPRWESWFREGLNAASLDDREKPEVTAGTP